MARHRRHRHEERRHRSKGASARHAEHHTLLPPGKLAARSALRAPLPPRQPLLQPLPDILGAPHPRSRRRRADPQPRRRPGTDRKRLPSHEQRVTALFYCALEEIPVTNLFMINISCTFAKETIKQEQLRHVLLKKPRY